MAAQVSVSNLAVIGGQNLFSATWDVDYGGTCLPDLLLDAVELWASADNDRANAAKMQEGITSAVDAGYQSGVTRYWWIRARDASGNYSDFYPSSATGGIAATTKLVLNADLGPASVGEPNVQEDAIRARHILVDNLEAISAVLGNVLVNGNLVVNGTLTTAKHSANSITAVLSAYTAGGIAIGGLLSASLNPDLTPYWTTVQTISGTAYGSEINLDALITGTVHGSPGDWGYIAVRLLRNGSELTSRRMYLNSDGTADGYWGAPIPLTFIDTPPAGSVTYTLQAAWHGSTLTTTSGATASGRLLRGFLRRGV